MTYNPYQQSTAPYGAGSNYPTPAPTVPNVPGYPPGATQSTPQNPGPGVVTPFSNYNPLLSSLSSALQTLQGYLGQLSSGGGSSGGSYSSGGGGGGGGGGASGGGAYINPATQQSIPIPNPVSAPPSYISNPVSGLANEATAEEKKKKLNESALNIQQSVTNPVPTRTSRWDTFLQGLKGRNPLIATMATTPTGTTLPPTGQTGQGLNYTPLPSFEEYKKQSASWGNAPITNPPETQIETGATGAGAGAGGGYSGGDITPPANSDKPLIDNTTLWNTLLGGMTVSLNSLYAAQKAYNDAAAKGLEPGRTPTEAAALYQQISDQAKAMYPQFGQMQDNITTIDKVMMDASIGFRKSAEAIRNNPDLSMWQQTRRLQELDDLQNYAPIFNGLSMKDLISYRNQLAESMNYYSGLFQDAIKGIAGLTDLTTPAERMAKSAEYLGKGAEWSTKAVEQLGTLAKLLIPTYDYKEEVNNVTGEVTWIISKVDPVTQQRYDIHRYSLGNIGQRTIKTSNSIWDTYDLTGGNTGTPSNAGSTPATLPTNWENLQIE